MDLSDRQQRILASARREGRVAVEPLAARHGVSPQTIRRDLNELCRRGLLSRVHGGAMPANSVSHVAYEERRHLAADAKARIAAAAARHIPDRCSLIVNIGTTTEQVARALYDKAGLVVITNNINVVNILTGAPGGNELVLAGGTVRQADGGIVGEAAVEFIRQFKVDCAVIGASALDADGTILDFDAREVSVARAIIASARRVILVADATKFERTAPIRICPLEAVDLFVTDAAPPASFRRACQAAGTAIEIAAPAPAGPRREAVHA